MNKEFRFYIMGFIYQSHITDLHKNNLLYEYLVLFEKLCAYGGKYIHKKAYLLKDLSTFTGIDQRKLLAIINILHEHKIITYKFGALYLNEPMLKYGMEHQTIQQTQVVEYKKEDIDDKTWAELMAEI